jgi:hypothetical protein
MYVCVSGGARALRVVPGLLPRRAPAPHAAVDADAPALPRGLRSLLPAGLMPPDLVLANLSIVHSCSERGVSARPHEFAAQTFSDRLRWTNASALSRKRRSSCITRCKLILATLICVDNVTCAGHYSHKIVNIISCKFLYFNFFYC